MLHRSSILKYISSKERYNYETDQQGDICIFTVSDYDDPSSCMRENRKAQVVGRVRFITMPEANSSIKSRVLKLLSKLKKPKIMRVCVLLRAILQ